MTHGSNRERIKWLLLGFLMAVGIFSLMGNKSKDDVLLLANGRYQMAAWGDGIAHGAFVMDTLTGETKIVYRYKDLGKDQFKERDNLKTLFTDIK